MKFSLKVVLLAISSLVGVGTITIIVYFVFINDKKVKEADQGDNTIPSETKVSDNGLDSNKKSVIPNPIPINNDNNLGEKIHEINQNNKLETVEINPDKSKENEKSTPSNDLENKNNESTHQNTLTLPKLDDESIGMADGSTAFGAEHNKWVKILLKGKNSPLSQVDLQELELNYKKALSLFDKAKNPEYFTVYSQRNYEFSYKAWINLFFYEPLLLIFASKIFKGEKMVEIPELKELYLVYRWSHFLNYVYLEGVSFSDFESEKEKFAAHLIDLRIIQPTFLSLLKVEFLKPDLDKEKIDSMAKIWKSFYYQPPKFHLKNTFYYLPCEVHDYDTARIYFTQEKFHSILSNYFSRQKLEANNEFNELKSFYPEISDLDSFVNTKFSPKFFPVNEAVINRNTSDLVNSSHCATNSIYQCLANFYPLLENLGLTKVSPHLSSKAKFFLDILNKVANPNGKKFDPTELMRIEWVNDSIHSLIPLEIIMRSFPGNGLYFNQVFGFAFSLIFFPPYFLNIWKDTTKSIDLTWITMFGQIFIVVIEPSLIDKNNRDLFDVPSSIQLKVKGEQEKKRYELYAFVHNKKSNIHAIAYVKRASGKWHICDSLSSSNIPVATDDVPITKAAQKKIPSGDRPFIAFYLRTEQ